MPMPRFLRAVACALPLLLSACGGGGSDNSGACPSVAASGGVADRQDWLRCYFNQNYLWYQLSPDPSPSAFTTVESYFDALLYDGGDPIPSGAGALWPADRYSGYQSTESFNRFFGDGRTLGYGVAVNGLEAVAQGATRLFVRYIEPQSPAALSSGVAGGLTRGDEILAINGRTAVDLIEDVRQDQFDILSPLAAGEVVRLDIRRATGLNVSVTLTAAEYSLTPVQNGRVVQSQSGRRIGYVFVKDMISQVTSPNAGGTSLSTVMSGFQGIDEFVLDLRYNGGGLVSMGSTVASYASGGTHAGEVYTRLLYNDKQSASNQTFTFSRPGGAFGFSKVYVLMGERTCSASEQVINGLRGVGVEVVAIGGVTCGKPVGFLPDDDGWGTTYSVVNFEGVNAQNQGRYFDGFVPTCPVAEDFAKPIGALDDPLLVAAASHADGNGCPVTQARETPQSLDSAKRMRYSGADGGERSGMSAR